MTRFCKKTGYFYIFCITALIIDRGSKSWALNNLSVYGEPSLFPFALHYNDGVAFSFLKGNPQMSFLLALVVLFCFLFFYLRYNNFYSPAMMLLFAGSMGNLFDRILYGHVIDWVYVGIYINLADVWLCLGGFFVLKNAFLEGK